MKKDVVELEPPLKKKKALVFPTSNAVDYSKNMRERPTRFM